MTCGPSICHTPARGSRWMSSCARRKRVLAHRRRFVRALLNIGFLIGQLLGLDREPSPGAWNLSKPGLTTADRSKSLVPVCTREGLFRVVYRFENEQLLELINRTAHAAALSALVETGKFVLLLLRRLRSPRWSLHADLHDPDRPVPQASCLSVALADRP